MFETVPYLGQTLHRWQVGQSTFLALPEQGARLMNWHLTHGDGSVRDVVHWPELANLDNFASVRGGNPVLFPFSARSFDRGDIYFWRDAAGTRRPMPMHGIARQSKFRLDRADAVGFAATLLPDAATREAYPYDYEFTVSYRFASTSLTCEFVLKNLDTQPIPWSAGHHFYFTAPWEEGRTRADYQLTVPATRHLRQNNTGQLVPGPDLPTTVGLSHPDWIDTFHLGLSSPVVTLSPIGGGPAGTLSVSLGLDKKNMPPPDATFVTWSASADAPYFCIEPWMGPPNAPETKVGLHWVPPGRSESFVVQVGLSS